MHFSAPSRLTLGLFPLLLAVGCAKEAADEVPLHDLTRPAYTEADLPDDLAAHVPGRVVVDFKDGTTKAQFDAWEKDWGVDLELADQEEGVDSAITVGSYAGDIDQLLATVRANPNVEVAEPMMTFHASFTPNDPDYGKQWNLAAINMPKAWERSHGKGVIVAVLDTGIAYENFEDFRQVPDLSGVKFTEGYDFVNQDRHANDDHGHGTHVAGTIAQATNNKEGVAGIAFEATLMPVKVLDHFGSGNTAGIADAIRWAADHGAKVINMSLGGGGRSEVMAHAVEYARKKGTVVVCAAGNGGRGTVEYPAAYPGAVAVGAVGPKGVKAPYSSWGKELDIAAPGGDKSLGEEFGVLQNTIDPRDPTKAVYAYYQGTSMATPHVAGVAALLFAAGARTPDQVEKALFASARPPPGMKGWTDQYGHGLLDADAALKALRKFDTAELLPPEVQVAEAAHEAQPRVAEQLYAFKPTDWRPIAWAAGMLAFVLLTLGKKERPGYLNVLVSPGFLVPMLLSTVGVFFVQWVASPSAVSTALLLPLPGWIERIIFGRGATVNPLVYSALLPVALSLLAISQKGLRPVVGGLAIGFAALFGYSAWAGAPALGWLPFTFLAIPWLVGNALVCLFVSRAMLKTEAP